MSPSDFPAPGEQMRATASGLSDCAPGNSVGLWLYYGNTPASKPVSHSPLQSCNFTNGTSCTMRFTAPTIGNEGYYYKAITRTGVESSFAGLYVVDNCSEGSGGLNLTFSPNNSPQPGAGVEATGA